jgi:hypothetical protein
MSAPGLEIEHSSGNADLRSSYDTPLIPLAPIPNLFSGTQTLPPLFLLVSLVLFQRIDTQDSPLVTFSSLLGTDGDAGYGDRHRSERFEGDGQRSEVGGTFGEEEEPGDEDRGGYCRSFCGTLEVLVECAAKESGQ